MDTTVTFDLMGSYVLRLEASDGSLTSTDETTILVSDILDPNQAPQVSATVEQDRVFATVTDDGLPNGTLSYSWSKVSGPGIATFANASAVDTSVSFSAAGDYVLQLEVSDGALTGSGNATITVSDQSQDSTQGDTGKREATGAIDFGLLISFSVLLLLRWLASHRLFIFRLVMHTESTKGAV